MPKKVVLVVIDGLTPGLLEGALDELPALRFLAEHGSYRRGSSVFPSLTPVCLSSLATGAHPDVHEIPHLVWYHRGERRLVEYGSSFGAIVAAGFSRSLRDTILNMNARHLGTGATTVFEAAEDAGLVPACVNFTA
jgi:predicted AlkP superfamily pyrophosphatase or phosphodiesterase